MPVIATFYIGLGVARTPSKQRRMEADRKRVADLRNLGNAIKLWHETKGAVPAALADLKAPLMADPETGAAYEYQVKTGATYELYANFSFEAESNFWGHRRGRSCFALDASKAVP